MENELVAAEGDRSRCGGNAQLTRVGFSSELRTWCERYRGDAAREHCVDSRALRVPFDRCQGRALSISSARQRDGALTRARDKRDRVSRWTDIRQRIRHPRWSKPSLHLLATPVARARAWRTGGECSSRFPRWSYDAYGRSA